MGNFLHLGKTIVNIDHVVSVKQLKPEAARTYFDPDARENITIPAKPVRVELTLTAIESDVHEYDYSTFHAVAASQSQKVTVSGDLAENVWKFFMVRSASFGAPEAEKVPA